MLLVAVMAGWLTACHAAGPEPKQAPTGTPPPWSADVAARTTGSSEASSSRRVHTGATTSTEPTSSWRDQELRSKFTDLAARTRGQLGIAIVVSTTGSSPSVVELGDWRTGPAWSTAKVPLAIAALDHLGGDPRSGPSVGPALTRSDNAAAQSLWDSLGGGADAAKQVDAALLAHGDKATRTQPWVTRPGFSAFGQTEWALSNQARFTASLACDHTPSGRAVYDLMGRVVDQHRWGIGRWPGARFKGGWGPGPTGAYTVRQFAVVPQGGVWTALAVAVAPANGSFATSVAQLGDVEKWLWTNRDLLPAYRC